MKNKCSLGIAIAFTLIFICYATPAIHAEPAVMISSYTLDPEVLMPGDSATLTVTIYNAETAAEQTTTQTTTGDTTITTVETDSGTIRRIQITKAYDDDKELSVNSYYDDVGLIASGKSIPFVFKMTAEENMSEGWYFPKVKVNLESPSHEDVEYPIAVQISNSTVDLIQKETPSKISISGSTSITLSVVNNFEASVDAVKVEPIEVEGLNISPKSFFIGSVDSDSNEDVSFSINPSSKGEFNLSFIVSYKNGENAHNSSLELPIEIIDSLDVAPVIYSVPSLVGKGESARIRLEIYNAKDEEITGVIVTPFNTDLSVSPSQYFIGSMDSDDVFSASFEADTSNLAIGENYSIDFKVSFKQGENYYETPSVNAAFSVVKATEASNPMNTCYTAIVIIIIVVAIVLFFFIRKRRKKQ
jgi:hypothetical protein